MIIQRRREKQDIPFYESNAKSAKEGEESEALKSSEA